MLEEYMGEHPLIIDKPPPRKYQENTYLIFFNKKGGFYFGIGPDTIDLETKKEENRFIGEIKASCVQEAITKIKFELEDLND